MSSVSTALAMAIIGNDYQYLGELGSGGGGAVVLARHVPMDRLVAVKAVSSSSRSALSRLRREGRVIAALDHPSIVNVYRLAEDGAVLALIMEYLDGGNLEDALDGQWLSGREVVATLEQVGSALRAAHDAGVVHRDVKPTNVLLGTGGRTVLADFGLTRLGGEFRTQSGAITGTPLYMSPEQITQPDTEAPTLDVYSYGALLYRTLTGRPPFVATDLKSLADLHLSSKPEAPRQVRDGVPKPVSDVVLGMLAKKPKDRPALREVLATLNRIDPQVWDEVLPKATEPPPTRVTPPARADQDVTAGDGTEVGDDSDAGLTTVAAPSRRMIVDQGRTLELEQPVYRPKRTHRLLKRVLIVAASVLVGLSIGVVVLLII